MTFKYMTTNREGQDRLIRINLSLEEMQTNQSCIKWLTIIYCVYTFNMSCLRYKESVLYTRRAILSSLHSAVHKCIDSALFCRSSICDISEFCKCNFWSSSTLNVQIGVNASRRVHAIHAYINK